MSRALFICLGPVALLLWATTANAQVATCVFVDAGARDSGALERLVENELARHTSHQLSAEPCEATLRVELIDLDAEMGGGLYLTGNMDGEVPHRVAVGKKGMGRAVEELLRVVLHNDPRRLRGPERADWFARQRRAFRVRGINYFGAELYEVGALVDGRVVTLAGVALVVRREVDWFHFGARLGGATSFSTTGEQLTLTSQVIAQLEAAMYSSSTAKTAVFGALALGLEYQRFRGPSGVSGDSSIEDGSVAGFSPGLRFGVELGRHTSMRASAFAQLLLPTFVSEDLDTEIVEQWTPSASIGAGLVF